MRVRLARAIVSFARPLRRIRRARPFLERVLDCAFTPGERQMFQDVCASTGHCLGDFYHWKLELVALARTIEKLEGKALSTFVQRSDRTDYASFESSLKDHRGLLVAIPHHAHFVMSICALVDALDRRREVHVFYDAPGAHPTNAMFDAMHARMYGAADADVRILHNDRKGIAAALQALRRGQIVILLPDVYKDVLETYQVSFCGATREVMLGAAALARRSGTRILPLVSRRLPHHLLAVPAIRNAHARSADLLAVRQKSRRRFQARFGDPARLDSGCRRPASS